MTVDGIPEQKIISFLREKIDPDLIYLFGSQAQGTARPESDVDIAYLGNSSLAPYERFMLAQELSRLIGKPVDLIDLSESTTVFQAQVVGSGKSIYCSDETKRMYFEMKVLKMYARLNEERAPILDKIKESGSVYGN
jgi:predicted nucleotidyltransferase